MGEKSCPAGTTKIADLASCKAAAVDLGHEFGQAIVEGTECHFCSGCTPNLVRLSDQHGPMAKFICAKAAAAEPAAQAAPATAKMAGPTSDSWPGCQEQNTVIRNAGQALFANLQGYGATIGCFLDDCMSSDKFVATEIESCTKVCVSLPECEYWVWGTEEGEQKCWFRTGDAGREAGDGWIAAKKSCAPPGTVPMVMGNDECWAENFGYAECCDAKYGPNGNAQCWDGVYNYDRCCFPKEEL